MFKMIGALFVIGASSLVGFGLGQRLVERCRLLRLWLHALEVLKAEIYYQADLLPEVFRKIARLIDDREMARAFQKSADGISFGAATGIIEIWPDLVARTGSFYLLPSDSLILNELGNYLGGTDRDDQCEKIKLCQSRLQNNLQLAETALRQKLNLFRYAGFAVGTMLVLLLI